MKDDVYDSNVYPISMPRTKEDKQFGRRGWILLGLVFLLSYFTFFHNYSFPSHIFWDEHHHVPNAQKYLSGIHHMEGHPPLGKMLIALGEKILDANSEENDKQFISVMNSSGTPENFSLVGYRLFPVLLGWLTAPLLFLIFFLILRNPLQAALLSFLYIFDNALIVHSRGALLDGPLIFFMALNILAFLLLCKPKTSRLRLILSSLLFGTSLAAAFATKFTGLFLVLLIPTLLFPFWCRWKRFVILLATSFAGFLIIFAGIWQTHFSLTTRIMPELPNKGYFEATEEHKKYLDAGTAPPITLLPSLILSAHKQMLTYHKRVVRLDMCNPSENGSPAFFWPLGGRSIPYLKQQNEVAYRYLYLQVNPVVWWGSIIAVLIAFSIFSSSLLLGLKLKQRFLIGTFLLLYCGYMVAISQVNRVMYLYHYFPALIISFVLTVLVLNEVQGLGEIKFTSERKTVLCLIFALLIFFSYQFYRPLTYFDPLTDKQVQKRAIFPLWNLRCANCNREDPLVVPRECNGEQTPRQ